MLKRKKKDRKTRLCKQVPHVNGFHSYLLHVRCEIGGFWPGIQVKINLMTVTSEQFRRTDL